VNAVKLLARARAAGIKVRAVGGQLRLRGRPDPDLVNAMREAKPALLRILTGQDCSRCGSQPAPLEFGGADRDGWICDGCLASAGLLFSPRGPASLQ
jgi:hypothetical protein